MRRVLSTLRHHAVCAVDRCNRFCQALDQRPAVMATPVKAREFIHLEARLRFSFLWL